MGKSGLEGCAESYLAWRCRQFLLGCMGSYETPMT